MPPTSDSPLLLVEDDDEYRTQLARQLQVHLDRAIVAAADGRNALQLLAHQDFAAIILDVGLPDVDGRTICRRLRSEGDLTPVIMISGGAEDADVVAGLDSGATEFLAKPFRFAALLARLQPHLESHARCRR